mmetsp:Transcript_2182/g.6494  ORF Transcript_2182/g.6494 Transcript_2182/m.6494 type:complete len:203 (+) Transcript_2182:679-1287(+)
MSGKVHLGNVASTCASEAQGAYLQTKGNATVTADAHRLNIVPFENPVRVCIHNVTLLVVNENKGRVFVKFETISLVGKCAAAVGRKAAARGLSVAKLRKARHLFVHKVDSAARRRLGLYGVQNIPVEANCRGCYIQTWHNSSAALPHKPPPVKRVHVPRVISAIFRHDEGRLLDNFRPQHRVLRHLSPLGANSRARVESHRV